jgi:hypothetical protein
MKDETAATHFDSQRPLLGLPGQVHVAPLPEGSIPAAAGSAILFSLDLRVTYAKSACL